MTDTAIRFTGGRLRPRDRDAIIASLRAGVVPHTGFQHIQVGRAEEVRSLAHDLDRVADGGSAVRFIIGDYGAGKTFFMALASGIALEKGHVTTRADLTPDRRLQSTGGQARSLYAELMRNVTTSSIRAGGALGDVVERFIISACTEADVTGGNPEQVIAQRLTALTKMTGGHHFAAVIRRFWEGYEAGNDAVKTDAIRWLRAEFITKSEARKALGVRTIIDDATFYDSLKLLATFVRLAGYAGLLVCLDEMVNLYKLPHTVSRHSNYEQVLRIVNDSLQGQAPGLAMCFGGTPDFLTDGRRGLYSYDALRSRLAENDFAVDGLVDMSSPVLRLANLSQEDLFVLLTKLRHVYAGGDVDAYLLPDEALLAFMERCASRMGDDYFRTPRRTVREFLNLLAVREQNPDVPWSEVIGRMGAGPRAMLDPSWQPAEQSDGHASDGTLSDGAHDGDAARAAWSGSEENDDLARFRL